MRTFVIAFALACFLVAIAAVPAMVMRFQQQEFIIKLLLQPRQYRPVPRPGMENA